MEIKEALARVVERQDLATNEMIDVMRQIMTGQCDDAQIGAFLVALRRAAPILAPVIVLLAQLERTGIDPRIGLLLPSHEC